MNVAFMRCEMSNGSWFFPARKIAGKSEEVD